MGVVSVTPRPRFTPGERIPSTHWLGGWASLRDGLDTEATGKIVDSAGDQTLVVQSLVRHYTDWATQLHTLFTRLIEIVKCKLEPH
jgi:hypothetical protein